MKIAILSLFPEMFDSFLNTSIIGRARQENLIEVQPVDIRPYSEKKHKNTYTSINGLEASRKRLDELTKNAVSAIAPYYDNAEFFRDLVLNLAKRTK